MNRLNSTLVLLLAFLAVFCQCAVAGPRHLLRAQIDLLPALMVLASLRLGVATVAALAILGGLWFDSLSANPLGVTVLPLFVTGFVLLHKRELILRDQPYAQFVLGTLASGATPLLTLLLLLGLGETPLLGWSSLWQWLVMAFGGGVATPMIFRLFDWLDRLLAYPPIVETTFRLDREIKRGPF
jgi:rod shape-determining protein MreD